MHMSYELQVYLVIIPQAVFKALCYLRGMLHPDLVLEGGNSDLVILKARTEEHICKLMGKLKFPEGLSIGRRWFANAIPSMLGF